jgi:hypothetical protein
MDASGIYVYTGGVPKKISEAVTKWIDGINLTDANKKLICAGNRGDKVWFNIPYASTANNKILVLDTVKNKWFVEDGNFSGFVNVSDNILYAFGTTDKQPYIIDSTRKDGVDGSTTAPSTIAWEFITKAYNDYDIDKQNGIKDMWLWYSGTTKATMSIEYSTDMIGSSSTFTELVPSSDIDFSGSAVKLQKPLPVTALQAQDSYRLRFIGTGQVTIHGVQVNQVSWGG